LYDNWRKFYGNDDPGTLVAYGTSTDFNPSLPQDEIDAALAEDRPRNAAEYLSEWRADLETFVPREAVEACVARGVFERVPERRISYFGFVDPAGGFGGDSMTLAIGHKNFAKQAVVIDSVREQGPPFSPDATIQEFAGVLKSYRISKVFGDKFAGGFPPEQFKHFGISFERSAKPKTDLYVDMLPSVVRPASEPEADDPFAQMTFEELKTELLAGLVSLFPELRVVHAQRQALIAGTRGP
jgi:hypothetical protein